LYCIISCIGVSSSGSSTLLADVCIAFVRGRWHLFIFCYMVALVCTNYSLFWD